MRSIRALAASMVLASAFLIVPASRPPAAVGIGPLPECRIDDILTVPRGYDDWEVTLVDWILSVGPDYKPPDLVSVRNAGIAGGGSVRKIAIDDLRALSDAAKANGTPLVAWSPYRSYRQQVKLFNIYAGWNGTRYTNFDRAINYSARPGHSEHQLGLTIDFVAVGDDGLTSNWEVTKTGGWMARNAWKYGWIMSYPKGKQAVTCYSYEPWHYRYVGRELAAKVHESGLTLREYLWANFTMVDPTTGEPLPTPSPIPSPTPAPTPAPTVAPTATLVPATANPTPVPTDAPVTSPGGFFGLEPPIAFALLLGLAGAGLVGGLLVTRRGRSA